MAAAAEASAGVRYGGRTLWRTVAGLELAALVILATGLGYLATHEKQTPEAPPAWPERLAAAALDDMNGTLQATVERWLACQNRTTNLAANASALRSEVAQLNARVHRQDLENKALQGEVVILKNWTRKLEELNDHQKEIIAHFRQQQWALSVSSRWCNPPPFLVLLVAVAVALQV